MATTTIAAQAPVSAFPFMHAEAVTAVAVDGQPVAFAVAAGTVRLAAALTADASVTLTYDAANPRAGALEHRLLAISNKLDELTSQVANQAAQIVALS